MSGAYLYEYGAITSSVVRKKNEKRFDENYLCKNNRSVERT